MVFHCRCFSFPLEEEIDIDIEDPKTQTNSTLTEPFYTAPSEFNKAMVEDLVDNVQSNLRVFTYAELEAATNNFCEDSKIGEDGFGSVYKGVIKNPENPLDEENQVTIKYGALKVNVLAVVEHPNIVKLIGYCREGCERGIYELLVYEYMPNKSVNHHLSTKSGAPLSWARRLKVAQDVARALTYLHEEMEFQYIFEDFTSSNIFLDEHWNAKLSDFRVAPLGPSGELTHVSTMDIVIKSETSGDGSQEDHNKITWVEPWRTDETAGYTAPEHTFILTQKPSSNTWSFGVLLFELITGRPPLDRTLSKQQLVEWVKPFLGSRKFKKILDPKLEGKYSLESAKSLSFIANRCLSRNPTLRPNMREILGKVNELIELPLQANNTAQGSKSMVRSRCCY